MNTIVLSVTGGDILAFHLQRITWIKRDGLESVGRRL